MTNLLRPYEPSAIAGAAVEDYKVFCEQTDYLEGVLWADPMHRLDKDPTRDVSGEIDAFGTGTKAFWRGVLETAGYIAYSTNSGRKYPRLELKGSYRFLNKFVAFLEEELLLYPSPDGNWAADNALDFQCSGSVLRLTGQKAHDVCSILYLNQDIGMESIRHVVDDIMTWTPSR